MSLVVCSSNLKYIKYLIYRYNILCIVFYDYLLISKQKQFYHLGIIIMFSTYLLLLLLKEYFLLYLCT